VVLAGAVASATATAVGGTGSIAGMATAIATAKGTSGSATANASTASTNGNLVQLASAETSGPADGTSNAESKVTIGGAALANVTGYQAVAIGTGAPSSASTKAVMTANPLIKTAFGTGPVFFAIGELGGAYSVGGTAASQTAAAEIDETVDLTLLASRTDLVIGFYNGAAFGSGVTGVTFDLYADGTDVLSKSFASAADAQTWFTNNAVDLGSLATDPQIDANTLTLKAVLMVTSTSAGSGFGGDVIIGDPPSSGVAASHRTFTQAMAESIAKSDMAVSSLPVLNQVSPLSLATPDIFRHA